MPDHPVLAFLQRRWFLLALVVVISGGMLTGSRLPDEAVASLGRLIPTKAATAAVLFLMAFSLDSRQLGASLRSPAPVLWAALVNVGLLPGLAWCVMGLQHTPDFRYGILIAGSVPCTLAAASVWTRKARGNDAVSLLVTLLTNGFCFLITPFWLNMALSGRSIQLDVRGMIVDLAVVVLIPTLVGQVVRQPAPLNAFSTRHKTAIGVVAQLLILSVILRASCDAGRRIESFSANLSLAAVLTVWGTSVALHLAGMGVAMVGAHRFGFSRPDRAAVAFAGSQKTLPIGILVSTERTMFGNPDLLGPGLGVPFAVFPILMYHVSQLFIDTLVADSLAARANDDDARGAQADGSTEPANPAELESDA